MLFSETEIKPKKVSAIINLNKLTIEECEPGLTSTGEKYPPVICIFIKFLHTAPALLPVCIFLIFARMEKNKI